MGVGSGRLFRPLRRYSPVPECPPVVRGAGAQLVAGGRGPWPVGATGFSSTGPPRPVCLPDTPAQDSAPAPTPAPASAHPWDPRPPRCRTRCPIGCGDAGHQGAFPQRPALPDRAAIRHPCSPLCSRKGGASAGEDAVPDGRAGDSAPRNIPTERYTVLFEHCDQVARAFPAADHPRPRSGAHLRGAAEARRARVEVWVEPGVEPRTEPRVEMPRTGEVADASHLAVSPDSSSFKEHADTVMSASDGLPCPLKAESAIGSLAGDRRRAAEAMPHDLTPAQHDTDA